MVDKIVAAALRKTDGEWGIIDDEGHTPLGVTSIEDVGDHLKLNFDFTADKVRSLVVAPDESYATQGYAFGSSVGLSSAKIYVYGPAQPVGGYAYYSNGWKSSVGNIESISEVNGHTIKVHHPEVSPPDELYLSITGRGPGKYLYRSEGAGSDWTNIGVYDLAGDPVTSFGSDMKLFITRSSRGGKISPSSLPEGWTNIWVYGQMKP